MQGRGLDEQILGCDFPSFLEGVVALAMTGLVSAMSLAESQKADADKNVATSQAAPVIVGIASHIQNCWVAARTAKQMEVEPRMLQALRARRGQYDPDKLAKIKAMGGSEVFAGITSVKCRAASSWLRDVVQATGGERPWTLRPTPMPDLPPDVADQIVKQATDVIKQMMAAGKTPDQGVVLQMMSTMKDQAHAKLVQDAREKANRMADKMEDQLIEGGLMEALDNALDDITTFPACIIKGPVIRRKKVMQWVTDGKNFVPKPTLTLVTEWERCDPFKIYPSPASVGINDGFLIEKHQLSRQDLNDLKGVPGYSDEAINKVLDEYGDKGLRDWLTHDLQQAEAAGLSMSQVSLNPNDLIDAIQFWGPVSGKMLRDWGMTDKEIPDPSLEYHVEAWQIGSYTIKAVLNYDPLARKPYYKASYEEVPGSFWGRSVYDLVEHPQQICNAIARAIVNNASMASGPQVVVNVDRLAPGETINTLTPWRIWQITNDPQGNGANEAITFKQPDSRVAELMGIFEKFSEMADDWSGMPKYMGGDPSGVGRTASGLSMLMGNANKGVKQVVGNVDHGIWEPLLQRLYDHNMEYSDDPDLKGDIHIVARGAASIMVKDAAQIRRNEFLASTANPIDMQIVGVEGRAAILRETAKGLDMNTDDIVPPLPVLRQKLAVAAALQAQNQAPSEGGEQDGPAPSASGQQLTNGAPVTDTFSPPAQ